MERTPLSEKQQSELADIPSFNSRKRGRRWRLRDRIVEFLDLGGIELSGASIENTSIRSTSFARARIGDTIFNKVTILEGVWQGAVLEGCSFRDCEFSQTSIQHSKFVNCTFESCKLDGWALDASELTGCTFKNIEGSRIALRESRLRDVSFEDCNLRLLSVRRSRLAKCSFVDCTLRKPVFDAVKHGDLAILRGKVESAGIKSSQFDRLVIDGTEIGALVITGLSNSRPVIRNCKEANWITVRESEIPAFELTGCEEARALCLDQTNINAVHLSACALMGLRIQGSRVGGRFEGVSVSDPCIRQANLENLSISSSTFDGQWRVEDSELRNLRLEAIRRPAGFALNESDVRYHGSNRLQG